MFFDPIYWLVVGAGLVLSLWASFKVKGTFAKYSQFATRSGMSGADVARRILAQNGIHDVEVEAIQGSLTDHYDPRTKTLRLSEPVFAGRSMAAFGVAAHEVGHAIQHARAYAPLKWRSAWVPVANIGGGLSMFVIMAALFLGGAASATGQTVGMIGVVLFATTTLFTLITLPVEFDASKRALATLQSGGYVSTEEWAGAKKVLDAAALTYVAAAITSIMTLLYWAYALGLFGGRRDD
ncbi:MAG TPA: zinc metallopeptidase [Candidatus Polarisedimenticolaceae bacterium]